MDVNVTLAELREISDRWGSGSLALNAPGYEIMDALADMIEKWQALDGWLSRGGFAPDEWRDCRVGRGVMSRKDYELIARVINESGLAVSDLRSLTERFADELSSDNPHFDRERFYAAAMCGQGGYTVT